MRYKTSFSPIPDKKVFDLTALDRRKSVRWSDISVAIKFSEAQHEEALFWIKNCLGYLPPYFSYLPKLGFIAGLLDNLEKGVLSKDEFMDELIYYTKQIRNDEMIKDGWVDTVTYKSSCTEYYISFLPQFQKAARQRLSDFLGYKPELKYSFEAEVFLRQLFTRKNYPTDLPYGQYDLKAATIVRYREAYLKEGLEAANQSELLGLLFIDRNPELYNLKESVWLN